MEDKKGTSFRFRFNLRKQIEYTIFGNDISSLIRPVQSINDAIECRYITFGQSLRNYVRTIVDTRVKWFRFNNNMLESNITLSTEKQYMLKLSMHDYLDVSMLMSCQFSAYNKKRDKISCSE